MVSETFERIDLLIAEHPEAQLASYTWAQLYARYLPPKPSSRERALMEIIEERSEIVEKVKALIGAGRGAEALELLEGLISKLPNDQSLSYMRVSIMAGQFEPKLALREVGKHCARFPNHRSGPALEAWLLLRMNKPQDALSRLNRAETAIGLNDYGKALKVEALRGLGRDEEALDMTDMSTQDPSLPTVWLKETLQEAKSEEQMLSVATRVRGAGEKPEWVALYVAGWYGQHGQIEEAEDTLIAALEDQPFDPGLNRYLAGVEVKLNRANDAFDRMKGVFGRNPTDVRALNWLLTHYFRRLQFIEFFRTVWRFSKAMGWLRAKP